MTKQIGQLRKNNVSAYVFNETSTNNNNQEPIVFSSSDNCYLESNSTDANNVFADFFYEKRITTGTEYYVNFDIAKDFHRKVVYNIRLIKKDGNKYNETSSYQHVKRIVVSRASASDNIFTIYAYGDRSSENPEEPYSIEANITTDTTGLTDSIEISIDMSKLQGITNDYEFYNVRFGFKAVDNFDGILIKRDVSGEDYSEHWDLNTTTTYKGSQTVIRKDTFKLVDLTDKNLISSSNSVENGKLPQNISKIGIWGHSGLPFMINGEEILIGSRGYYELELKDISISSLCPICTTSDDVYLIDYEYSSN